MLDFNLKKIIEDFDTQNLLKFLENNQKLKLDDNDFKLLKESKITGFSIFHFTKDDFLSIGLKRGPAIAITVLIQSINEGVILPEFFIPCIKKLENPYRKYFSETSLKSWSFENFRCWINHYDVNAINLHYPETLFVDMIRKIKDDSTTLMEISDFLTELIRNDIDPICSLLSENIYLFIKQICEFHETKTFREFYDYNESAFQTTVQMLIPTEKRLSEMRLIKNTDKKYRFVDIFVMGYNDIGLKSSVVFELKYLSLKGLYSGEMNKWVEDADTSYKKLKELDDKLIQESDEEILKRNYYYWCKLKKRYQAILVSELIERGIDQIKSYIKIIKRGKYKGKEGIMENNILIQDAESILGGWIIACLGSKRIITRKIDYKKINYTFDKIII